MPADTKSLKQYTPGLPSELVKRLLSGDDATDSLDSRVTALEQGGGGGGSASGVTYSNTTSLLNATNVQTAIDEVENRVDVIEEYLLDIPGDNAPVAYLRGFSDSNFAQMASDPLSGSTEVTIATLFRIREPGTSRQHIFGTAQSSGGVGISTAVSWFNVSERLLASSSEGNLHQEQIAFVLGQRWILSVQHVVYNANGGADKNVRVAVNTTYVINNYEVGSGGTVGAGARLTLGVHGANAGASGSNGSACSRVDIAGAAYKLGFFDPAEIGQLYKDTKAQGTLANLASGWTAGWTVGATAPTGNWNATYGTGTLIVNGTLTREVDSIPEYL